jgi:4-hydroxybenzoate polyprenyltransferase
MKHFKIINVLRLDNITKHIFILPGISFSYLYNDFQLNFFLILIGMLSATFLSSSNYLMNEFVDRNSDRFHPFKKERELVGQNIDLKNILLIYIILIIFAFYLANKINIYFFCVILIFWINAILYNIKPIKLKDYAIFDISSEALNNPLRLFLGWFMFENWSDTNTIDLKLPPISLIVLYFSLGVFLMTSKRYAEYLFFNKFSNKNKLISYRKSYKFYNTNNLLVILFFALMVMAFNSGVFLYKYRVELILIYPLLLLIFSYYFYLTIKNPEKSIFPEKIYIDKKLLLLVLCFSILFILLINIDFDIVNVIFEKKFF